MPFERIEREITDGEAWSPYLEPDFGLTINTWQYWEERHKQHLSDRIVWTTNTQLLENKLQMTTTLYGRV
jgi:hypothetical protein